MVQSLNVTLLVQEAAVGRALAGNTFSAWTCVAGGTVALVHAGTKSCMAVANASPTGIYYWGEDYAPQMPKKAMEAVFQPVGKARILQVASTRFGAALDCNGGLYVCLRSDWKQIATDATSMAAGASAVHFVQHRTAMTMQVGVNSAVGPAKVVPGLPAQSIASVASGTLSAAGRVMNLTVARVFSSNRLPNVLRRAV